MQRVVEAIAVVLLLAVGGVGGYLLWTRSGSPPAPVEEATQPQQPHQIAVTPTPSPPIPHVGDPLRMRKAEPSATTSAAAMPLPSGVQVRHIYMFPQKFAISPDGHWGVAIEHFKGALRGAVWDLDKGKLQRFLSAELNKGTAPYAGRDDADFGANVELPFPTMIAFSPSGKRFAALRSEYGGGKVSTIYAWDVASGKLLCQYVEGTSAALHLSFPSDDSVIFEAQHALIRLNVDTLEADLLRPYVYNDLITWSEPHGDQVFVATMHSMGAISLTTKEYRQFPEPPQNATPSTELSVDNSDPAALLQALQQAMKSQQQRQAMPNYSQAAISADGKHVVAWGTGGRGVIWEIDTGKGQERVHDDGQPKGPRMILGKVTAGLLPIMGKAPTSIQFIDVTTDNVVTTLRVPFLSAYLQGMSATATRLVVGTDQHSALVVDLPEGLPPGTFDLADAIGDNKLPSTR